MDEAIEKAAAWLEAAGPGRVTVLTGAGISTDSGIADYRGPQGAWTKDPEAERMATLRDYLDDPEVRKRAWRGRTTSPAWTAEPNAGHRAIVDLQTTGRLHSVVTQNVDGLHQKAGIADDKTIELHGNMHSTVCWTCGDRRPMAEAIARVTQEHDEDPRCRVCGGILKSATILFGEQLDPAVLAKAQAAADEAEVFVAAGSTLVVHPAASLVPRAKRNGATLIIANQEETPYDRIADAVLRGSLSTVLPSIL